MPSKTLGTGNRKGAIQRPNTSNTSPGSIRLQQRRGTALELRLAGKPFRTIARQLKCSPQTAFNYIATVMENTIPQESAKQLLTLELQRFDALLERFYAQALKGDKAAAELCLKIAHQRARLCGLYPDNGKQPLVFNVEGNAETLGIAVKFVAPDPKLFKDDPPRERYWPDPPMRQVEALPAPRPMPDIEPSAAPSDKVVPLRPDFTGAKPEFPQQSPLGPGAGQGWVDAVTRPSVAARPKLSHGGHIVMMDHGLQGNNTLIFNGLVRYTLRGNSIG